MVAKTFVFSLLFPDSAYDTVQYSLKAYFNVAAQSLAITVYVLLRLLKAKLPHLAETRLNRPFYAPHLACLLPRYTIRTTKSRLRMITLSTSFNSVFERRGNRNETDPFAHTDIHEFVAPF